MCLLSPGIPNVQNRQSNCLATEDLVLLPVGAAAALFLVPQGSGASADVREEQLTGLGWLLAKPALGPRTASMTKAAAGRADQTRIAAFDSDALTRFR
jgi:hypothetical protein